MPNYEELWKRLRTEIQTAGEWPKDSLVGAFLDATSARKMLTQLLEAMDVYEGPTFIAGNRPDEHKARIEQMKRQHAVDMEFLYERPRRATAAIAEKLDKLTQMVQAQVQAQQQLDAEQYSHVPSCYCPGCKKPVRILPTALHPGDDGGDAWWAHTTPGAGREEGDVNQGIEWRHELADSADYKNIDAVLAFEAP